MFAVEECPGAVTYYTSSNKIPREKNNDVWELHKLLLKLFAFFVNMGTIP